MNPTRDSGYAALIVVITLAAALSAALVGSTAESYYLTDYVGKLAAKKQSYYQARSCAWQARLELVENPSYRGDEQFPYSDFACTIRSIVKTGATIAIDAESAAGQASTRLEAVYSALSGSLISIREIFD